MGLDGPKFCHTLVFTVVGTLWSLVFSRCSVYLLNLYFVFSSPCGPLGTSTFKFTLYNCNPAVVVNHDLQCFSYFWTNFFYDVLSNFGTAFWSRTALVVESAHRLWDLLSTLQICKRVLQDILKKLLSICGTVITFLRGQCPICRTVVSLGRSILPPGLEPSKSGFKGLSPKWYFSITLLLAT